jgi:hypothetical protein
MAFIQPTGIDLPLDKNLLMGIMIETETNNATTQSINTCFVTEKSIPNIVGRWMIGWEISELET